PQVAPHRPSCSLFPYTTLFRSEALLPDETVEEPLAGLDVDLERLAVRLGRRHVALQRVAVRLLPDVQHQVRDVAAVEHLGLVARSEEHTSELQSPDHLVCRLLL